MGRGPGTRNPYTPDSGAQPPALTGREVELDHFREIVTQVSLGGTEKHLVMTGLRGVGKTVLLNVFEKMCAENGWHGEVNEISEETELGPFIARETRRALLAMSALRRAGDTVKKALRVVKGFSLTVGEATLEFDVDAIPGKADSGDLATDLRDLIVEVGAAAKACDAAFALILDEVHNLERSEFEALIIGLHRAKQKNLPIAFVGGGLPLLPELTREAKTYAERLVYMSALASLGDDPQRSGDVAQATGRSVQTASKIRDALMQQSRVYSPEYGYVAFTVPQCADYLRRHHPLENLLGE